MCDAEIKTFGGFYSQGGDVIYCTQCGAALQDAHQYCWNCGKKADISAPFARIPGSQSTYVHAEPRGPASQRRLGQLFGLDPRVAFVTLIVDMMLNAGDLATMGLLVPISLAAGIVVGYIAYKAQISWYGDDKESARIKAAVLGLLTAIPTPLPEILYVPAGLIGLFHRFRNKESIPKSAGD
jgi:hypothetical protein